MESYVDAKTVWDTEEEDNVLLACSDDERVKEVTSNSAVDDVTKAIAAKGVIRKLLF
jgi:hypothetical protein